VLDSIFYLYGSLAEFDDKEIAKDIRTLIALFRAREVLAQEDALLAGVLAEGEFSGTEHSEFVRLVGAQRLMHAVTAPELPSSDRAKYEQLVGGATFTRYRVLEDRVVQMGPVGEPLPVTATEWSNAIEPVFADLNDLSVTGGREVVSRATPVAIGVVVRLMLAGLLGLFAVIASIVMSITTARSLVRQLNRLRMAAVDLANRRLPRVVDRLQHGEKVDVEHEAPPLEFGRDEIGQVGQAFNMVQETAVRVAVEQAELRRSVRDVFLSLARRSQALLHRQLALLDGMERRTTDSEELAELFRIDHLATRMRRNAENLIVLSGATAGRVWRKPVPMLDVIRGALAEVEDYTRVNVLPIGDALLQGRAVGDVIHLLAELIENAVSFSPPQTIVRVGGSIVGTGFAVEIEDRGLGISDANRAKANEQLRNPPEFKLTSTARLGLYVVAKLAERHHIRVQLIESPYGGTTAIVLIPTELVVEESSHGIRQIDSRPAPEPATVATRTRHALDPYEADHHATPLTTTTAVAELVPDDELPVFGQVVAGRRGDQTEAAPASQRTPASTTAPPDTTPPALTPSGLPWRKKQPDRLPTVPIPRTAVSIVTAPDSPAPTSSNGQTPSGQPTTEDGSTRKRAEHMRNLMSSYRTGTLRGRSEAAREIEPITPEWTEVPTEPTPTEHHPEEGA
jgi:signal transduction histidine kinase